MDKKSLKALLWSSGIAVVLSLLTVITSDGSLPKWSIIALGTLGGVFFSLAVFMQGWLKAPFWFGTPLRSIAILGIIASSMFFISWAAWPLPRRHVLTDDERKAFQDPLTKQQSERDEIRLACPAADENACVYGSQFINYFREAGWKVKGNQLERVTLGVPYAGVILVEHADGKPDPNNWRSGVWVKVTPSTESVYEAFVNIGIQSDEISDVELPENAMRIYFGSEKRNAAERTSFSDVMDNVKAYHLRAGQ